MTTLESLDETNPEQVSTPTEMALGIAEHIRHFGKGLTEYAKPSHFVLEVGLHVATDKELDRVLQDEAAAMYREADITVYRIGEALVFREMQYYDDETKQRPYGVTYNSCKADAFTTPSVEV